MLNYIPLSGIKTLNIFSSFSGVCIVCYCLLTGANVMDQIYQLLSQFPVDVCFVWIFLLGVDSRVTISTIVKIVHCVDFMIIQII